MTGRPSLWLLSIAAWGFVAAAAALAIVRVTTSARIVVTERGLIVPRGRWTRGEQGISLDEIVSLEQRAVGGQIFLTIRHAGGVFTLHQGSLPERSDYDLILDFLRTGTWLGKGNGAETGSATRKTLDPEQDQVRRRTRSASDSDLAAIPPSWFRTALKLFALLTFCGGPLYVSEVVKPHVGQTSAFVIGIAPVLVLAFVVLMVVEERPLRHSPLLVWGGWLSLGAILIESAVATFQVVAREVPKDTGLILFGSAVSVVTAVIYQRLTRAT